MTSPLLCLVLVCCVGWPTPAWWRRPVVDSWPTASAAREIHRPRCAIQQAAHPGPLDDGSSLVATPSEFDDAEDPEDLVPLKRTSPGDGLGFAGFEWFPSGSACGFARSSLARPHPALFRNQPIRC